MVLCELPPQHKLDETLHHTRTHTACAQLDAPHGTQQLQELLPAQMSLLIFRRSVHGFASHPRRSSAFHLAPSLRNQEQH
jgi:hypothetical protein